MDSWLSKQIAALTNKTRWYWITGVVVILLGLCASHYAAEENFWVKPRRIVYKWLSDRLPIAERPIRCVLVLVDDDQYWLGEPAGRRPTKRDYLGRLISATAVANPAVIAIDFILRSPSPDGNPIDHPEYKQETDALVKAVNDATASTCSVVLPRTMDLKDDGTFTIDSAVYDGHELSDRVYQGYINLPEDDRRVPVNDVKARDGRVLDSFAQAMLRADHVLISVTDAEGRLPFGRFAKLEAFERVLAGDVLCGHKRALRSLEHKIVIIGGYWHEEGLGCGDFIDMHDSPLGSVPGIVLHANYAGNILQSHLYREWKENPSRILEIGTALFVGFVFALELGWWVKALAVIFVASFLVLASVFSIVLFALVFDFFIPVVMIAAHGVLAPFVESRFHTPT